MKKSPWVILVMGVLGCAALAVMSQYYLRQSPTLKIREGLERDLHVSGVSVTASDDGSGYTVTYTCPRASENPRALKRSMIEVAEYVRSRLSLRRVRVIARTSENETSELIYPPEDPPPPENKPPDDPSARQS